jgi:hypothetical protein
MPAPPPLIGTYPTPRVRRRQRVWCEYRSKWCRVTSFTADLIPWPRVAPEGQKGGSGLWVNDTLATAIRTESGAALKHWFGVSQGAANRWRRWAGVEGWTATAGTRVAVKGAAEKGAEATRGRELSDAECDRRAEAARRNRQGRFLLGRRWPEGWTAEMDAKLGTVPDKVLAKRLGRTRDAVRARRSKLGVPPA